MKTPVQAGRMMARTLTGLTAREIRSSFKSSLRRSWTSLRPLACTGLAIGGLLLLHASALGRDGILVQKLPNGLTVILEEDHSRPLIATSLVVDGGSRTENQDLLGLSHYYEHLIFRGGSKEQAELEYRRQMQQLGEESGGYTTDDFTNYGFTVPKENFDEAFRRATDAWLNLNLTQEKVDNERQVVLEEYFQGQDRPDHRLYYQLVETLYKVHPYHWTPIGLKKVIDGASLETFRTFYEERYVPNQMILALVGDFQAAEVLRKIQVAWGPYPSGRPSFEQGLIEPEQTEFRSVELPMKTAESRVILAFPIPPGSHADLPALELTAALLATGNSSRLWQSLKARNDIARSVGAAADRRVDPGLFEIDLELPPEQTGEALRRISEELVTLKSSLPSAEELRRARETLLAERERRQQTLFARAEALCVAELHGSAFDTDRVPALLTAVNPEDVSRVVATYLRPERGTLSVVRPEEAAAFDPAPWVAQWQQTWREATSPIAGIAESRIDLLGEGTSGAASGAASRTTAGSAGEGTTDPGSARTVLANGVTLVVRPLPSAKVVGAVAMVRGGQWAEPPELGGIANFTARLLDRGAVGKTQIEIADQLGNLGATLSARGEQDMISATLEVPARGHLPALEILAELLTEPAFPAEEIEKVREDLLSSIRSLPDRTFDNTNRAFYAEVYRHSPYARLVEGSEESVSRVDGETIRTFWERTLNGSNLVICVAGPVDPEAITSWAERRFGSLPRGIPVSIDSAAQDQAPKEKGDIVVTREQEQVTYNTGWPTVAVTDPDYVPLRAAVGVLSDRFFFKYVYEKGVAYRSWFYMTERLGQGTAQNEMGVSSDVYGAVSSEVVEDLERFVSEPLPPEELVASQKKLRARHYLGTQTSVTLARRLAFYELAGLGHEYFERYPEALSAVTPSQAQGAAKKYFPSGRWVRVAVGKPNGSP